MRRTYLAGFALCCSVAWPLTFACSGAPDVPPCDPATLAGIVAECATRVETECASQDIPEADCEALKECDARLDARLESCR